VVMPPILTLTIVPRHSAAIPGRDALSQK